MKKAAGVSVLLTNSQGKLLLQLRSDYSHLEYPNHWTLPGGHVEPGETPEEAVRRELIEEMNLSLPLWLWTVYDSLRGNGTVAFTNYLYRGKLDRPAEDIPLYEGQQLRYFSRGEIDQIPVAFGFETQIKRFFEEYEST